MGECKSGRCEMQGQSYEDSGCTCGCSDECSCGCGSSCTCGCQDHAKCHELISLAKQAHTQLLVQKMKAAFEKKIGKKMDKVAELAVDAMLVYTRDRMSERQAHEEFDKKLMEIFRKG